MKTPVNSQSGEVLLETILIVPLLLMIAINGAQFASIAVRKAEVLRTIRQLAYSSALQSDALTKENLADELRQELSNALGLLYYVDKTISPTIELTEGLSKRAISLPYSLLNEQDTSELELNELELRITVAINGLIPWLGKPLAISETVVIVPRH